jgi:hypothetical protein
MDFTPSNSKPPEWTPPPDDPHYCQCFNCRWWYDMRDFEALLYHATRGHETPRREAQRGA